MPLSDVRPLQEGLAFGVRIGALTRDQVNDPAIRQEVASLFVKHGMIVFENVEQSDERQVAISTIFGPLKEHPVKALARVDSERLPGVIELRTKPHSGGVVEVNGKQLAHWLPWHFDHCYNDELNYAGVLRAVTIVDEGGITGFMDGIALYEAFPRDLRELEHGREAILGARILIHDDRLQLGALVRRRLGHAPPLGIALHRAGLRHGVSFSR